MLQHPTAIFVYVPPDVVRLAEWCCSWSSWNQQWNIPPVRSPCHTYQAWNFEVWPSFIRMCNKDLMLYCRWVELKPYHHGPIWTQGNTEAYLYLNCLCRFGKSGTVISHNHPFGDDFHDFKVQRGRITGALGNLSKRSCAPRNSRAYPHCYRQVWHETMRDNPFAESEFESGPACQQATRFQDKN